MPVQSRSYICGFFGQRSSYGLRSSSETVLRKEPAVAHSSVCDDVTGPASWVTRWALDCRLVVIVHFRLRCNSMPPAGPCGGTESDDITRREPLHNKQTLHLPFPPRAAERPRGTAATYRRKHHQTFIKTHQA